MRSARTIAIQACERPMLRAGEPGGHGDVAAATIFRRGRLALVAALGALGIATLLGTATASAEHLTATGSPGGPTVPWGFNEDWGWPPPGDPSYPYFNADLANTQLETAGAIMPDSLSANRFHVQWADVEWRRGSYDWSRTDPVYTAMQDNTAQPVMLLYNTPDWARDPAASCPAAPDPCAYPPRAKFDRQWKNFVKAAVRRYPNVRAIEIWNEPNTGRFWAPAPNPTRYSSVLKAAHEAVRSAKATAPVLVGGLAPGGASGEFLEQVYETAGAGAFEGIASHPYPGQFASNPYTGYEPYVTRMWSRLDNLREVRDEAGDGDTPLWITEVGVSTDYPTDGAVPLEDQGDVLVALYRSIEGHDVNSFIIHRLHDVGTVGGYWHEFGVIEENLAPKPAYCELGASIGTPCAP